MERAEFRAGMTRDLGEAFGEQLRREREQRGLAVETICASTKVPVRHILALEAGAFRDLPGGVFRRGFLRSYLEALGLEQSAWMPRFEESCRQVGVPDAGDTAWTAFAENVRNSRAIPRRRTPFRRLRIALLLILLTAGGLVAAGTLGHRNRVRYPHAWTALKSWVDKVSFR